MINSEINYYLLEQDLRIPGIAAIGELPEYMEPLDWTSGRKMNAPGQLRLRLSNNSGELRTDFMGSLLPLFSDALKEAMDQFPVNNVDYFPIELEDPSTNEIETGYWLANVVGQIDCLDASRSTIIDRPSGARGRLESFYIDPQRTQGQQIFRLAEQPALIIISQDLRKYLLSLSLSGIRLRHTKVYDGF